MLVLVSKSATFPPVFTYGALTLISGSVALWFAPQLAWWAIVLAPLVMFALWQAYRRTERSLASGIATTFTSSLALPMMWCVSVSKATMVDVPAAIWLVWALCCVYLVGTVFYVKTNVRKKGSRGYLAASIAVHTLGLAASVAAAFSYGGVGAWLTCVAWVCALGRAVFVPLIGARGRRVPIPVIGVGEVVLSILFLVAFAAY